MHKSLIIGYCLIIFIVNLVKFTHTKCEKLFKRKEIRQLTPTEISQYFDAIQKLHKTKDDEFLPEYNDHSVYEKFAIIHSKNKGIHGNPMFLPFHRRMLREFESRLQAINPNVAIPYWDWTLEADKPGDSIVFTDNYFGGNGDTKDNHLLKNGPFKFMEFKYPRESFLTRNFVNGTLPPFYPIAAVLNLLTYQNFFKFYQEWEYFHGVPHNTIGSYDNELKIPSQIGTMYSPLDPIFYSHHAFVDRVWFSWQVIHSNLTQYRGSDNMENEFTLNDTIPYFGGKVSSTLDIINSTDYCYEYDIYHYEVEQNLMKKENIDTCQKEKNNNESKNAKDSCNYNKLKPHKVTDSFLEMNNINKSISNPIRQKVQKILKNITENGIPQKLLKIGEEQLRLYFSSGDNNYPKIILSMICLTISIFNKYIL